MKLSFIEIGDGQPVVLLHAFPLSALMWKSQAEALAQKGFRVILPDLPGFGDSNLTNQRFTIEEMAVEVSKLLDFLEIDKAIIGGLSMGGYVLFNLLRFAPEKFSALIFCDTTYAADAAEKINSRYELISKIEQDGPTALIENMLPNLISDFTKQNNPKLTDNLKEIFLRVNLVCQSQ